MIANFLCKCTDMYHSVWEITFREWGGHVKSGKLFGVGPSVILQENKLCRSLV
jgi:hypothetical protein